MKRSAINLAHLRSRKNQLFKIISVHRRGIYAKIMNERVVMEQYPGNA